MGHRQREIKARSRRWRVHKRWRRDAFEFFDRTGFRGGFDLAMLADELTAFLGEIQTLGSNLLGTAELKTMEEQVHIKLTGDGKGHIALEGEVVDRAGDGNRLSFALELDQTQLRHSISQMEQVVRAFPVRRAEL